MEPGGFARLQSTIVKGDRERGDQKRQDLPRCRIMCEPAVPAAGLQPFVASVYLGEPIDEAARGVRVEHARVVAGQHIPQYRRGERLGRP